MSKDLLKRADGIMKNNSRIIKEMAPLKEEYPWMDHLDKCFTENNVLIQELLDKIKGDAERMESEGLLEEVVKVMSEVIEKRSIREIDYFALEMTGDEADNGDYVEPIATGNILFDGCLQMKDIAQAAINVIKGDDNDR